MSRCDVWISEVNRERARPLVESMNIPDAASVRLPVQSWPTELNWNEPGPTFSMEVGLGGRDPIGVSAGYDVFGRTGWTSRKFAQFIASREELHVPREKAICPTLAVLAGYLHSQIFSSCQLDGFRDLSFITVDGGVTKARFEGGENELEQFRHTFFADGLAAALSLPGLIRIRRTSSGTRKPLPSKRMFKMVPRLEEWWGSYERGERVAPLGAELSCLDLKHWDEDEMDPETRVVAFARTSKHLYELVLPPDDQEHRPLDLFCAIDGVLQQWTDPATGEKQGFGAYPVDWAEWIIHDSVPGHPTAGPQPAGTLPWEGDGAEARVERMANGIVTYDQHEAALATFLRASELEVWLKRALGSHNAPISVHLLDDISLSLASENMPLYERHSWDRSDASDATIRYYPREFRPWSGTETWRHPETRRHSWSPSISTQIDGQTLQAFTAANCMKFSAVKEHLLPPDEWADPYSWFVVHLEETDTCILLPYWRSFVSVSTDNDWATAAIAGHQYFDHVDSSVRKRKFENQWASWLDGSPLSKDDITQGLAALENLIERSGDEPDDEDW